MSRYRAKPVEVEAVKFEGGEDAAAAVIAWAKALGVDAHRYEHRASWNDSKPDLRVRFGGIHVRAGEWAVLQHDEESGWYLDDVLDEDEFAAQFEAGS